MKKLYDPELMRQRLLWALTGGLLAMVLVPLAMVLLNSTIGTGADTPVIVRQSVLKDSGWPWQGLLAAELALAFAHANPSHLRLSGSDCHRAEDIGMGGILTATLPETEQGFVSLLRSGQYTLI